MEKSEKVVLSEKKPSTSNKINYWTGTEKLRYLVFLIKYNDIMVKKMLDICSERKPHNKVGLYPKLSKFIKTKSQLECSDFHTRTLQNFQIVEKAI